jgi:Subtilase family
MNRALISTLCAGALVASAVAAVATSPAEAADSQATATTADAGTAGAVRTVTLITGDRVAVAASADGHPSVTVVAGNDGPSTAFQVLSSGAHLYVVPQIAAGYVGAPMDLSLFDVNAATPQQLDVEYDTAARPALPGTTATGPATLTVSDPAAFGRAIAADRAVGKAHGSLFAGVRRLTRKGSAAPAAKTGQPGQLYTVTVKAFDRLGRRAEGTMATAMSAENVDNYLAGQAFFNGEVAFSVPAGHYSIDSYIPTGYDDKGPDYTLAAAPEVDVTRDTTVVLDARKGVRFSAAVAEPTTQIAAQLNYQRNPAVGLSFTDSLVSFGTTPLYATPTEQVHTGQLYFYPSLRLGDADGSVQRVQYDMEFPSVGAIPATLTHQVSASQLATIDAKYHSPVAGRAEFEARQGKMPWQAVQVFAASQVVAPVSRTEYVLALPDLAWLQQVILYEQEFLGFTSDRIRTYQAGEHSTSDWAAQPMAPGLDEETVVGQACPACRTGDTLNLTLYGYTDRDGHYGLWDPSITQNLTLYQDGKEIGHAPDDRAAFPLSPTSASYRLVSDVSREAAWWPSSSRTHTAWSFTSAGRAPDQLPAGWTCPAGSGGGRGDAAGGSADPATGCSFEPLLFTKYSTGAGVNDVVPAGGPATLDVTVAHQFGAAPTPITSFTGQVSYDDGATWTDVPAAALGDGHYRLSYTQPELDATSGYASLHITATDAAGSAIDQTITRAYPLSIPATTPASGGQTVPAQVRACDTAAAAPYAQCMAIVNAAAGLSADQPVGLSPTDIQSAYRISADRGQGRTVAIVDAYDNPNAEADLAVYRAKYGLPPCTTANGCFRKVNQHGQSGPLPVPSTGWGLEISLDLDAVSAACPACDILLVEADSSNFGDMLTGVLTAAALGADAISNSYGSRGEFSGEQTLERYLRDLRVPALFATGDYGYGNGAILVGGISYPAASQYVVAVGGTSLTPDGSGRGWTETAWDGATSGCSAYIRKPAWQKDSLCGMRTVADISAVADPDTGLAVYDTFGWDGWVQVGGTSLATPIVASMYAAAGIEAKPQYVADLYRDPSMLFDAVGGSNGTNCSDTYLCTAVPGYDGPTGLGTPDGSAPYWR